MRRALRSLLASCPIVLGLATSVFATPFELQLGERYLELAEVGNLISTAELPKARVGGFAQLAATSAGGEVGAGAALAIGGLGCSVVDVKAQGRLRPQAEQAAGQLDYHVCFSRVAVTFELSGHRGIDLSPAFDTRRSLWARPYRSTYDRLVIGGGELGEGVWGDPSGARHGFFIMALGHGEIEQHDPVAGERRIVELDVDVTMYRLRRGGLELEALLLEMEALKSRSDDLGAVVMTLSPVRVSLDEGDVFVRAHGGWAEKQGFAKGSGSTQVNGETVSSWEETIDSTGLPDVAVLVGEVEVGLRPWGKEGRLEARASGRRGLYPTFDGDLALEDRLSATVAWQLGQARPLLVELAPFATRTRTFAREVDASVADTYGTGLRLGRDLRTWLRVDAVGEVGFTPYARLDGERLGQGQLGARVGVAVSTRLAR